MNENTRYDDWFWEPTRRFMILILAARIPAEELSKVGIDRDAVIKEHWGYFYGKDKNGKDKK